MQPYKETLEDINLKWGQTYVLINEKIVFIHAAYYIDDDESKPYLVKIFSDGISSMVENFDLESLKPLLFDSQFFNISNLEMNVAVESYQSGCLLLARNPRRQNKRSICYENTTVRSPVEFFNKWLYSHRQPQEYRLTTDMIQSLIKPIFPPYERALAFCKNNIAVAISPLFAVTLSNIHPDKYLLASQWGFIGEADKNTLYIHHPGSFQEVIDFVQRSHLNLEVINCPDL